MSALEGTIDVPKIGRVKKVYVYGAGGAVAAYVAWRWWQAGSAPAEDTSAGAPVVDDSFPGTIGADIGTGSGGYYGTPPIGGDTTVGQPIATNSAWFQAAVDYLTSVGRDGGAAADALGKYLDKQPLTKTEQGYVRTALGAVGNPPQGTFTLIDVPETAPSALVAPKGLKVTSTTTSTAVLSWDAVPGADSYGVYRSDTGTTVVGVGTGTTATVAGLQPGTSYSFSVAARRGSTVGPRSSSVSGKTQTVKLAAPTSLKGTATKTTVTLTFKGVPGADGYRAYREGVSQNVGGSRDTTIQVGGLKSNTSYRFRVAALAGPTTGPTSGWITVKTKK